MATDPDAALHRARAGLYKPGNEPPAPPAADGTIADTIEHLPELRGSRPTATPIEDPASLSDVFSASKRVARSDRSDFNEIRIRDGYAPIVTALGLPDSENPQTYIPYNQAPGFGPKGMQGQRSRIAGDGTFREGQEQAIVNLIRQHRARDPKFLAGVPDTVDGLHKYFLDAEISKRRQAQATLGRSPGGIGGFLAELGGGGLETFHDPVNLVTMPIGGGGKTLVGIAAREALTQGILELGQQPLVAHNRAEIGEHLTIGEALTNSATAAAGGAVLGPALHVAGRGVKIAGAPVSRYVGNLDLSNNLSYRIYSAMPERLKNKWGARVVTQWAKRISEGETLQDVFGELNNVELATLSRTITGEQKMTPDELAAIHVLERGQEVGESSPYHPGPTGDAPHETNLGDAIRDLEDRLAPEDPAPASSATAGAASAEPARPRGPSTSPPRPHVSTRFEIEDGPTTTQAAIDRYIAKTRHVESTGNDAADNPRSSADGRFQITDGTFRRLPQAAVRRGSRRSPVPGVQERSRQARADHGRDHPRRRRQARVDGRGGQRRQSVLDALPRRPPTARRCSRRPSRRSSGSFRRACSRQTRSCAASRRAK
jgi:hypothetical protein